MHTVRRAESRGHANHGWLDSYHSFSFADYYDPAHMSFSNLRVINEDRVEPGAGFPTHGHRDMEIVTYVLDGELEHKDSLGNGSVMRYGDVQRMSAGTGVRHSEFNPSASEPLHLLQIWLEPNQRGVTPGYDQRYFDPEARRGRLVLLVSPDGRDGSIAAHQDALLLGTLLDDGQQVSHPLADGRKAYLHLARGNAVVNGERLRPGDAIAIAAADAVSIEAVDHAEAILFDLP
jgi:redox-sensitive bicupin YhaK (pirin superfamily)